MAHPAVRTSGVFYPDALVFVKVTYSKISCDKQAGKNLFSVFKAAS